MSQCIACGAELEPPVRVPHTVYVKTLYRVATTSSEPRSPPVSSPR